ncbi:hypothetical protein D623_10000434 [Myotis brandtii]|uniref:Uncharacterized protein n=1 Tax=Myotis brandtii TaxID=109478 RepID=S7QB06_MYOBR|nr:hypothetical protein D623_10000434 [Myotis brandtii]
MIPVLLPCRLPTPHLCLCTYKAFPRMITVLSLAFAPGSPPCVTTSLPCGVSQFSVKPPAPSTQQCDFVTG